MTSLSARLVSRMRLRARLTALTVALLVPTLYAGWSFTTNITGQIAFSSAERHGLTALGPALDALGQVASGQDSIDLATLRVATAGEPQLDTAKAMAAVEAAAKPATPADRLVLARALADLVTQVGNTSNLILDPDLDSFYVMDALVVQGPKALVGATQAAIEPTGSHDQAVAAQAVLAGTLAGTGSALASDVKTSAANTKDVFLDQGLAPLNGAADALTALSATLTNNLAEPAAVKPDAAVSAITEASPAAVAVLDRLLQVRVSHLERTRTTTLAVLLIGVLLAAGWAALVGATTSKDVRKALGGIRALADRDLTPQDVPTGADEFGDIGAALTTAREHLADAFGRVVDAAGTVASTAVEVTDASRRVGQSTDHTRAQSEETAQVAAGVIGRLGEVSEATNQMRVSTDEIASTMSSVTDAAQSARDDLASAVQLATDLGESSRRIEETVKSINTIAEQTNLLALNATIEASRAGEAGRGFAVVAGEVKDLAREAKAAAANIGQVAADQAGEIARVITTIRRASDAMASAADAQTTVAAATEEQTVTIADVAQNLAGTVAASEQIAAQVHEVRTVATGTTDDVRALESASTTMTSASTALSAQVSAFRI